MSFKMKFKIRFNIHNWIQILNFVQVPFLLLYLNTDLKLLVNENTKFSFIILFIISSLHYKFSGIEYIMFILGNGSFIFFFLFFRKYINTLNIKTLVFITLLLSISLLWFKKNSCHGYSQLKLLIEFHSSSCLKIKN